MATEASACAERGVSAPPEVVFDTAIDPDRTPAWLPEQIRNSDGPARRAASADELRARWSGGSPRGWSLALQVRPVAAGGAMVRLELAGDAPQEQLTELAEETLANLAGAVGDRLTAG